MCLCWGNHCPTPPVSLNNNNVNNIFNFINFINTNHNLNNKTNKQQVYPADSVQDLRQWVYDLPETCFVTNFYIELDGQR